MAFTYWFCTSCSFGGHRERERHRLEDDGGSGQGHSATGYIHPNSPKKSYSSHYQVPLLGMHYWSASCIHFLRTSHEIPKISNVMVASDHGLIVLRQVIQRGHSQHLDGRLRETKLWLIVAYRWLPLRNQGPMANPPINRTANKLRLLVPSALRAPAAGYLAR